MTAYRLATRCRLHLWSTKRTLGSLKRKGLVEATATDRLNPDEPGERVRAQLWSLTKKGVYKILELIAENNWAISRVYQNYPLFFVELRPRGVPVAPRGRRLGS